MKLKYRKTSVRHTRRQHALPRAEEIALATKGPDFVESEMCRLLIDISMKGAIEYHAHPEMHRANSLIWIWVQMSQEKVVSNIRILMARRGLTSINQLAARADLNASFVSRLLSAEKPEDLGGWNVDQVFRFSSVLGARPELMMTVDLTGAIDEKVIKRKVD